MASLMENPVSKKPNLFMAKRKLRQSPRIIYLACEGTQTEYWYFKSLDEALDEDAGVRLRIYPEQADLALSRQPGQGGIKTAPNSLCAKAAEKLQGGQGIDEAWIVIDKDGHQDLEETFTEAASHDIRIAFSSISFEYWLLLHFEKNDTVFQKSDCKTPNERGNDVYVKCGSQKPKYPAVNCRGQRCVAGWLRIKQYLPEFDKSSNNLFQVTQDRHTLAFENAVWLRWRKYAEVEAAQGRIYKINPYTTMDLLLKSIYRDNQVVSWCNWGMPVQTSELILIIQKSGDQTFKIHAHNVGERSLVMLSSNFYLSNEHGEKLLLELAFESGQTNVLLSPQQDVELEIISNAVPLEPFYLNYTSGNYRLIFSEQSE